MLLQCEQCFLPKSHCSTTVSELEADFIQHLGHTQPSILGLEMCTFMVTNPCTPLKIPNSGPSSQSLGQLI